MKKLLLLIILFPFLTFSQSAYDHEDIIAAAEHEQQWLLTNVAGDQTEYAYGIKEMVAPFIKNMTKWDAKYISCGANCKKWVHESNVPSKLKKRNITYKLYYDTLSSGQRISTKVVFEGSKDLIIDFFMTYWTDDLEFVEGTNGDQYLASVRFLTDVATLRITKEGDASIVVKTGKAKNTFATTISSND